MIRTETEAFDPARKLLPRLAGFFALLRSRGVAVGIGAELDLTEALTRIPMLDRRSFLDASRTTLAKSALDLQRLDAAFEEYWGSSVPRDPAASRAAAPTTRPPPDGVATPTYLDSSRVLADPIDVVRFGLYSPDAPSAVHVVAMSDRKRRAAMGAGARRFRRQMATLPGRRYERAHRGRIDYLSTARASLRHGGEWAQVRFHRKKRQRAEIVILWDVSGSMREHDGDLFALAYSLQRSVRRCRIFGFSTQLQDLTPAIRGRSYVRASAAIARSLRSTGGGTRIGRCLEEFLDRHGDLVHPRTTLLVMSDGWDLGETAALGRVLERLHQRCHMLVWVNPYADDSRFEPETAGMQEALPHVDLFLAPSNFETTRPFRTLRGPSAAS